MNFVPQVETREISDADMDSVSGGLSISGGLSVSGVGSIDGGLMVNAPAVTVSVTGPDTSATGSLVSSL